MGQSLSIVVPTFNEAIKLRETLNSLVHFVHEHLHQAGTLLKSFSIVIIDDGSKIPIQTSILRPGNSLDIPIFLLRHELNLGQGAALETGVQFAYQKLQSDFFATFDGDNQHNPGDIIPFLKVLMEQKLDIVFGNRFLNGLSNVPSSRAYLLKAAAKFEKFITKVQVSDAHNGFRVFNRKVAEVFHLKQNRMAHATEIKQIIFRHKLKYGEAATTIRYSRDSIGKGQKNIDSFYILKDLLIYYLLES